MRSIILCASLLVSSSFFAQKTYSSNDYFNLLNASAFSEKNIYVSNSMNYGEYGNKTSIYNYFSIKYRINKFSFGISHEFNQFALYKSTCTAFQIGYPKKLNDHIILNSGLRCNVKQDNAINNIDPSQFTNNWNPNYFMLDFGLSLQSENWHIGIGGNNLNRPMRTINPIKYRTPYFLAFNASYRIILDSLQHFSITHSLNYELDVINHNETLFASMQMNVYQHSFGVFSIIDNNFGAFYQYNFKKKYSIGASFNSNKVYYDHPKQWDLMLRVSFCIDSKEE
jgi:hypothetical protein